VRLSALVVERDEAGQLGACLSRLAFCDEIVVVLDRSVDASRIVALGYGAKLVEGVWPIEGARRQAGQDACSGDWILEVDADERVTSGLAAEIRSILETRRPDGPDWWRIPFDNYIGDRLVRYGWGAQFGVGAKAILYRRGCKAWGAQRVHPSVQMTGRPGGALVNRMVHYVDRNIADMLRRLDRYTTLNAMDLRESGAAGGFHKNVLRIFGRFWKCYVRRKGYREGGLGLAIAIFAGLYPFLSWLKAQEERLSPEAVDKSVGKSA
jgi:glycosyltransferase involved in cell wall biosynthesis